MRLVALACALLAAGLASVPREARAGEAPELEPTPATRSYAWQTLAVEYGSAALAVRGVWIQNPLMARVGVATWCFGGAAVHAAHGNAGAAVASPLLQIGVPLLLGGVGWIGTSNRWDKDENAAVLAIVGVLGAPILDALLAREPRPKERAPGGASAAANPTVSLSPGVSRDRVTLDLVGAF